MGKRGKDTSIRMTPKFKEELKKLKRGGETYEDVIKRLKNRRR